jgi:hypothetical protein
MPALDLSVVNNRLTFIADYYVKNTSESVGWNATPSPAGYQTSQENIGFYQKNGV